jgi:crotonobetainyl-CoA:carnitine CoA-transferase CaiB-like acyl-CoA transferase
VAGRIAERSAEDWRAVFAGKDLCCSIVSSVQDAFTDPQFRARGLFAHQLPTDTHTLCALPVPVVERFRDPKPVGYPRLGADNELLGRA